MPGAVGVGPGAVGPPGVDPGPGGLGIGVGVGAGGAALVLQLPQALALGAAEEPACRGGIDGGRARRSPRSASPRAHQRWPPWRPRARPAGRARTAAPWPPPLGWCRWCGPASPPGCGRRRPATRPTRRPWPPPSTSPCGPCARSAPRAPPAPGASPAASTPGRARPPRRRARRRPREPGERPAPACSQPYEGGVTVQRARPESGTAPRTEARMAAMALASQCSVRCSGSPSTARRSSADVPHECE